MISEHRNHKAVVGVFLAATAVAWILTAMGRDGWIPFSAWISSMATACIAVRSGQKTVGFCRSDWIAAIFVTLLAAFFRLYQLDTIPNGLWIDEVLTADNAAALSRSHSFAPFDTTLLSPIEPEGDRQCNLYLYFAWLVQWIFGFGRTGIKMISVLPGILAVPALFFLARSFMNRTASLAAAGLFAVSTWHVTLSRWGWAELLSTALFILVFFFIHRGVKTGSHRSFLLAGILSGLSLYTYLSSRLGVAAVFAFLCLHLLQKRGRQQGQVLALYLLGLCVAGFPAFMIWYHDPGYFWGRMSSVSILSEAMGGNLDGLTNNIASHLLMFHWSGDRNPRHNLSGDPMLNLLTGAVFLAGLVVACCKIKKTESQFCLLWLSFGLLGGILTQTEEAPHGYRTGLAIPACFLLVGLALETLGAFLRKKISAGDRILLVVVLLLLSASASVNFTKYFVDRPASKLAWYSSLGGVAKLIRDHVKERAGEGYEVYIDETYRNFILEFELELLYRNDSTGEVKQRVHWFDVRKKPKDLSFLHDPAKRIALFLVPGNLDKLDARLPNTSMEELKNSFGDLLSVLITRAR